VAFAYREWFPPPAPSVDVLAPLWARDVQDADAVIVAADGAVVVGSAVARAGGDLARVHVHPSRWGEGIAQRLHAAAVDALRDAGHVEARLWVIERNARARALYERNGWVLVPDECIEELGVVEVRYRLAL
jgi:GNAT superfamily N-acetyltransferase